MTRFLFLILIMLVAPTICSAALVERVGGQHATLALLDPQPAAGASIVQPETGATITRLTDVAMMANPDSPNPKAWDGVSTIGLQNGYSRFPCVSIDGKYALAFGVTPLACLLELGTSPPRFMGLIKTKEGFKVGDQQELKWGRDPKRPHVVLYMIGREHREQDVVVGPSSERVIVTYDAWFRHTSDGDPSSDGHYIAMALSNGQVRVTDLWAREILPGWIAASPNGADVSPDGRSVRVDNRFWRLDDLKTTGAARVLRTVGAGHGGWAVDVDGTSWFVQQDTRTDWLCAYEPIGDRWKYIMRMPEIGGGNYGVGIHVASDKAAAYPGHALVSAYQTGGPFAHNAFFVPLASCLADGALHPTYNGGNYARWTDYMLPAAQWPLIVRVANMQHQYFAGQYFTEGCASLDAQGRIYWGGNWRGTDNLELYQCEPGEATRKVLAGGVVAPTPTPTATPTVTPSPTATPVVPTPTPSPTVTPLPGGRTLRVPVAVMARTFKDPKASAQTTVQGQRLPLWAFVGGEGNGERDQSVILATDWPTTLTAGDVRRATLNLWIASNGGRYSRASGQIPVRAITEPWRRPYTGADGLLYGPTWALSEVTRYYMSSVTPGKIISGTGTRWSDRPAAGPFTTAGDLSTALQPLDMAGRFDLPPNGNGAWVPIDMTASALNQHGHYIDVSNPGAPGIEPGQVTTLCASVVTPNGPEALRPYWTIELAAQPVPGPTPTPTPEPTPTPTPAVREIEVRAGETIVIKGVQ